MSSQPFDISGDTDVAIANEDFASNLWLGADDCSLDGEPLQPFPVDDTAAWGDVPHEDDLYVDDSGVWDYDATVYPEGDDFYVDDTAAWGDVPHEDDFYFDDWGYSPDLGETAYTDYAVDDWGYWEGDSYYEPSGESWYGEGDYTMFDFDGMTTMYGPGTTGEDIVHDLS